MRQTTTPPQRENASGYWREYLRGVYFSAMFDKLLEMGFSADPLGPPSCKGVYVVTSTPWPQNNVCHILYVGRSNNIATRVSSKYHPYKKLFASVRGGVSLWCKPCEDAERVEVEIIKALRPKYNVQHNGEEIY